jgi:hypothetical protein
MIPADWEFTQNYDRLSSAGFFVDEHYPKCYTAYEARNLYLHLGIY